MSKDGTMLLSLSEFDEINKRLANLESMVEDMRNMLCKVRFA